jgi:predicted metal-dependent peptidase
MVSVSLPHLAGLAHSVRILADERVEIAGVFPSGKLLINPGTFAEFSDIERAFVLGHELLHLALHTHERTGESDHDAFNFAHDCIINDILETELGLEPPGGGLRRPGSRHESAEGLMLQAMANPQPGGPGSRPFGSPRRAPDTPFGQALREALHGRDYAPAPEAQPGPDDVLTDELEAEWFPNESPQQRAAATATIRREATKALALQRIQEAAEAAAEAASSIEVQAGGGAEEDRSSIYVDALDLTYRPPWQLALHRWLDAVTTPVRTYARPSRRAGDRTDVALPGRRRDAQTISIVLDTSGSMRGEIAHALGSIMAFGRGANIEAVRILQCDNAVTADDIVDIEDLATFEVSGFGGSDMSPAMLHLAEDPQVTAVVVITDGYIDYPELAPPYEVLWVVYDNDDFSPPYGQVILTTVSI